MLTVYYVVLRAFTETNHTQSDISDSPRCGKKSPVVFWWQAPRRSRLHDAVHISLGAGKMLPGIRQHLHAESGRGWPVKTATSNGEIFVCTCVKMPDQGPWLSASMVWLAI